MLEVLAMLGYQRGAEFVQSLPKSRKDFGSYNILYWPLLLRFRVDVYLKLRVLVVSGSSQGCDPDTGNIQRTRIPRCHAQPPVP